MEFIKYECEEAIKAGIEIVVLYKSPKVDRSKCPSATRNVGKHIPMLNVNGVTYDWNHEEILNVWSKVHFHSHLLLDYIKVIQMSIHKGEVI